MQPGNRAPIPAKPKRNPGRKKSGNNRGAGSKEDNAVLNRAFR